MKDVAIRLENISKFYKLYDSPEDRLKESLSVFGKKYHKRFYALKGINLEIKKGEIIGIVGKNGCGKSTLLKLISGVLVPNMGEIEVKGKISALLELGAGFNPEFSGLKNIFFYGTILGFSEKEMESKLDDILDFAEIGDFIHQPLKTYSSGMKSRLGFAVAVHIDPEILILDEVLSVGDMLFQRKCYAKMEEFFKGGKTIIYVSHNMNSVNELCDRAILLMDGEILLDGDVKTVTNYYQKILFSDANVEIGKTVIAKNKGAISAGVCKPDQNKEAFHDNNFLPDLISANSVEIKNEDVLIDNARIIDDQGKRVNLLEFNQVYKFLVDMSFGVDAENVAFGFEIKDIKGVAIATVESYLMYKKGVSYNVNKGDVYKLEFTFKCLLKTGMYYINLGTSSFKGEQKILNRVIDLMVFKTLNQKGCSSGYLDLVDNVKINTGKEIFIMNIL